MKVLNKSAQDILSSFRDAYFNQIGRQMNLASEEHILSSVYSYVLSTFTGVLNKSYEDRFLSTATGEALDRIAEQYGLSRRKETLKDIGPFFDLIGRVKFKSQYGNLNTYPAGTIKFKMNGVEYYNLYDIKMVPQPIDEGSAETITLGKRFVTDQRNISKMSGTEIAKYSEDHKDDNYLDWPFQPFTEFQCPDGIQNLEDVYFEDDEEFRQYIIANKRLFVPGLAETFEALMQLTSESVLSCHCVRQNETCAVPGNKGFEPGYADIYVRCRGNQADSQKLQIGLLREALKDVVDRYKALTLGQTVRVHIASKAVDVFPAKETFWLYVPKEFKGVSDNWFKAQMNNKALYTLTYLFKRHWGVGKQLDFDQFIYYLEKPLSSFTTFEYINDPEYLSSTITEEIFNRCKDITCQVYNSTINPNTIRKVGPDQILSWSSVHINQWTFNTTFV